MKCFDKERLASRKLTSARGAHSNTNMSCCDQPLWRPYLRRSIHNTVEPYQPLSKSSATNPPHLKPQAITNTNRYCSCIYNGWPLIRIRYPKIIRRLQRVPCCGWTGRLFYCHFNHTLYISSIIQMFRRPAIALPPRQSLLFANYLKKRAHYSVRDHYRMLTRSDLVI